MSDIQSYDEYMRRKATEQKRDEASARRWPSIPEDIEIQIVALGEEIKNHYRAPVDDPPSSLTHTASEFIAMCTNYGLRHNLRRYENECHNGSDRTAKREARLREFAVAYPQILEIRRLFGLYHEPDFLDVEERLGKPYIIESRRNA